VLEQQLSAAPSAVVVDPSDTVSVGVARVAALLLSAAGRAAENLTTLCLVTPPDTGLVRPLRTVGLDVLFDLHPSVADCRSVLALSGTGASGTPDLPIAVWPVGRLDLVRRSGPLSLRTVARGHGARRAAPRRRPGLWISHQAGGHHSKPAASSA
jgi:hypothetical protein